MCTEYHKNCGEEMVKFYRNEIEFPLHDDKKHFEILSLFSIQCGIQQDTVLSRRDAIKEAFDYFDFMIIAHYTESKIEELLHNDGIIRSQKKIEAIINNAEKYFNIIQENGSFDNFLMKCCLTHLENGENNCNISTMISLCLKRKGFLFVGTKTVYKYLQAIGFIK